MNTCEGSDQPVLTMEYCLIEHSNSSCYSRKWYRPVLL